MGDRGIIYVATGDVYRHEACLSAQTVNEVMPNIPVTIFSDKPFDQDTVAQFIQIEEPSFGYRDKIACLRKSPYDKTIFLDTDIGLYSDISDIFTLLEKFDLAAAHDPDRRERPDHPLPNVPAALPEYNTGIVAFSDSERVHQFLQRWLKIFDAETGGVSHDQPSFRKALFETDVRISTLPEEYNCLYAGHPGYVSGIVRVFHGRLLDDGRFSGLDKKYEQEEVMQQLNSTDVPRVYTHNRRFEVKTSERSPLDKLVRSYNQRGIIGTVKKQFRKFNRKYVTGTFIICYLVIEHGLCKCYNSNL